MIIDEEEWTALGMSIEKGLNAGYRNEDGKLTRDYLRRSTITCEGYAKEFEIALKAFHYHYPLEGKYKISWKIERVAD